MALGTSAETATPGPKAGQRPKSVHASDDAASAAEKASEVHPPDVVTSPSLDVNGKPRQSEGFIVIDPEADAEAAAKAAEVAKAKAAERHAAEAAELRKHNLHGHAGG